VLLLADVRQAGVTQQVEVEAGSCLAGGPAAALPQVPELHYAVHACGAAGGWVGVEGVVGMRSVGVRAV
jgi:hypothetical protein